MNYYLYYIFKSSAYIKRILTVRKGCTQQLLSTDTYDK